jgi:hypothetical protein
MTEHYGFWLFLIALVFAGAVSFEKLWRTKR